MRNRLKIKNLIIAFLITAIYFIWLIDGLSVLKIVTACASMFVAFFVLLELSDNLYIKGKKENRSELRNESRK